MISQASERDTADYHLVQQCLDGDEHAWQVLVDKYKRLVFSIALAYHSGTPDAVFETIWRRSLENLESVGPSLSFRRWLTELSLRTALYGATQENQGEEFSRSVTEQWRQIDPEVLCRIDQEQDIRECIESLPPRYREQVGMVFFSHQPVSCSKISIESGLVAGSTIAGKCLHELVDKLVVTGFMD